MTAVVANRDPNSPLYDRIDLSRTFFAGHSGGGQAALQAGSVFPGIASLIDPAMRVRGVLAVQPGPLAVGALVGVPTLFLTVYNDFVVPDFAWVRWWQYNLTFRASGWIANARGVSHCNVLWCNGKPLPQDVFVALLVHAGQIVTALLGLPRGAR
ncbi:hypothetical protein [Nocardia sp. NBC_00403]|uniref:hypothetical protein n=1 Tax=Nocardia sp. NBC_00403 TaxID=2975990 RepID=UPI002E1FB228